MTLGSVRHHVRVERSAAEVWAMVGDPARVHEWFPGIVASEVDGAQRTITLGTGARMPEEILVHDDVQRRFVYRITGPSVQHHRGTIDVLESGLADCTVVYATDADPRTMALIIGGATAGALDEVKRQMEVG
jgi:carbon monoxide dehydrogenase subunit G